MNLRNKWLLLLFTLSAYMVLYYVYDTPCRSIYINGASLLGRDSMIEQCMIDMVRYVYGYLGIVMMLVVSTCRCITICQVFISGNGCCGLVKTL